MAHIPAETKNQAPSLRERMRRAICMKDARNRVCAKRCVYGDMCPYQAIADAAIEAMIEPTEAMVDAAVAVADDDVRDGMDGNDVGPLLAAEIWRAMARRAGAEGGEMTKNQTPRAIIADAVEDEIRHQLHTFEHDQEKIADLALAALEAAGLVIVPAEPTEAMIEASWDLTDLPAGNEGIWAAMVRAAR